MKFKADWYPAKMVPRLANELVEEHVSPGDFVLDPFCGSGIILAQAFNTSSLAIGCDINPVALLLSEVKANSFSCSFVKKYLSEMKKFLLLSNKSFSVDWDNKEYWFNRKTLMEIEKIRYFLKENKIQKRAERMAILYLFVRASRVCSFADPKSPKPFISKQAIKIKKGWNCSPIEIMLENIQNIYSITDKEGRRKVKTFYFDCALPVANSKGLRKYCGKIDAIITSPPYINAQDYARNFRIEMNVLNGLFPFDMEVSTNNMLGTELLSFQVEQYFVPDDFHFAYKNVLLDLNSISKRHSFVAFKYFSSMERVLLNFSDLLRHRGRLVLVCGDNLVAGRRVYTWKIIKEMAESIGFELFNLKTDVIQSRNLAPNRLGHKGIIKEEVVLMFTRS